MNIDRKQDVLIVVDVQYDFLPGGALGVAGGDEVIALINRVIPHFKYVVFTRDWHPTDHVSFSAEPQFIDKSWPVHCVAGSQGAELHRDLQIPSGALLINKGTQSDTEAYSTFQGTRLAEKLQTLGIKRIFIAGLATDYCVKFSTLDALKNGFETVVLEDAVRGVHPDSSAQALQDIRKEGATFIQTAEIG